ncbi:MAG: hypothetical protein LBH52_01330 [Puniceicoccales bacterium]|jgi:hypothetical protein|nr:hypothetical protein [Puniceicoccales bacterium]
MSIGGTPLNSDQLLSQLQGLRQQGLGDRQLALGPNGEVSASAKATPFERFCNLFSSKPSSPKQGDALQKLQTILEQKCRGLVGYLIGNKKPITINDAAQGIKQAKPQFQQLIATFPQEMRDTSVVQELARNNPTEAKRLGEALTNMMKLLQPNEAQKQVLCELILNVQDPKEILAFARAAINNPIGAGNFLSNLSGLEPNSRSQEFSKLFAEEEQVFNKCVLCFHKLSNAILVANAANEIHTAMQTNPTTDGLTRATQGAAEIAKHLITGSGQLADERFIAEFKAMLAEGAMLPGVNNAFLVQQLDRLLRDKNLQAQLLNIGRNGISPVAHQAIRETLGLPPDAPITAKEAQQAALAAMLSPLRQGAVGSCFATAVAINIHDTRPSEMLRDMASLIERGYLERQNGYAHIQIPFNQNMFNSPTQIETASAPTETIASSAPQKSGITGNPLLRCWEYTLSTSAGRHLASTANQQLTSLAYEVLSQLQGEDEDEDETIERVCQFMQYAVCEYDPNKMSPSAADGHSSRGAFTLSYTSPHNGQKFEIKTAEDLHKAFEDFAERSLTVNSEFESTASEIFKHLTTGGSLKLALMAQYDIEAEGENGLNGLHTANAGLVRSLDDLPILLFGVAGKIASEADKRHVPMPLRVPMLHSTHGFNMRLDDPILQEGIRTGAWESPEKRQAFLEQQLKEPMQAKILDSNDPRLLQFFDNLKSFFPPSTNPEKVFNDIVDKLPRLDKYSYEDLAFAVQEVLKKNFRNSPKLIMAALAPLCPQMMFADTNWESDGKPTHWGIQYNPITGQFGIVQGIQNDSGKYDFVLLQPSESTFNSCEIIDDSRVLFGT